MRRAAQGSPLARTALRQTTRKQTNTCHNETADQKVTLPSRDRHRPTTSTHVTNIRPNGHRLCSTGSHPSSIYAHSVQNLQCEPTTPGLPPAMDPVPNRCLPSYRASSATHPVGLHTSKTVAALPTAGAVGKRGTAFRPRTESLLDMGR